MIPFYQGDSDFEGTPAADVEGASDDTDDKLPDNPFIGWPDSYWEAGVPLPGVQAIGEGGYAGVMPGPSTPSEERDPRLSGFSAYVVGDEHTMFENRSPETIWVYQQHMIAGGWVTEGSITPGNWDNTSANAMAEMMGIANRTGRSWADIMAQGSRFGAARGAYGRGRGGSGSGGGRGPTIRLSNPEDLKLAFRQVARDVTGGVFVEEDQIDAMVKAFQGEEASFQRKAALGGTVTAPPTPQAFAVSQLEELDPGGAEANRFQSMTRVLQSIIGSPF